MWCREGQHQCGREMALPLSVTHRSCQRQRFLERRDHLCGHVGPLQQRRLLAHLLGHPVEVCGDPCLTLGLVRAPVALLALAAAVVGEGAARAALGRVGPAAVRAGVRPAGPRRVPRQERRAIAGVTHWAEGRSACPLGAQQPAPTKQLNRDSCHNPHTPPRPPHAASRRAARHRLPLGCGSAESPQSLARSSRRPHGAPAGWFSFLAKVGHMFGAGSLLDAEGPRRRWVGWVDTSTVARCAIGPPHPSARPSFRAGCRPRQP